MTLQLDPMPLARLSRRALLLGYRDDLLLSLLVAELDTNNSFLSGITKENPNYRININEMEEEIK